MELKDCNSDPEFRKEFIKFEMNAIEEIIQGNVGALNHNETSLSILEEIQNKLTLDQIEQDVLEEHINGLKKINIDIKESNDRLKVLVNLYRRSLPTNNLKLAK